MTLVDWISFAFDILKAITFDFSSVGLDITLSMYNIMWGFLLIGFFFIIYTYFVGGRYL